MDTNKNGDSNSNYRVRMSLSAEHIASSIQLYESAQPIKMIAGRLKHAVLSNCLVTITDGKYRDCTPPALQSLVDQRWQGWMGHAVDWLAATGICAIGLRKVKNMQVRRGIFGEHLVPCVVDLRQVQVDMEMTKSGISFHYHGLDRQFLSITTMVLRKPVCTGSSWKVDDTPLRRWAQTQARLDRLLELQSVGQYYRTIPLIVTSSAAPAHGIVTDGVGTAATASASMMRFVDSMPVRDDAYNGHYDSDLWCLPPGSGDEFTEVERITQLYIDLKRRVSKINNSKEIQDTHPPRVLDLPVGRQTGHLVRADSLLEDIRYIQSESVNQSYAVFGVRPPDNSNNRLGSKIRTGAERGRQSNSASDNSIHSQMLDLHVCCYEIRQCLMEAGRVMLSVIMGASGESTGMTCAIHLLRPVQASELESLCKIEDQSPLVQRLTLLSMGLPAVLSRGMKRKRVHQHEKIHNNRNRDDGSSESDSEDEA